jgi:hypothetical protein
MATAPQQVTSLASMNRDVSAWVESVAKLTQPDHVYWCDGSAAEFQALERELVASRELLPLNSQSYPGCVLSRSNPSDVARRTPDLRLHPEQRRCGPEQQLDCSRAGPRPDGCLVCRLHERTYSVRRPLLHGADRLAVLSMRRRNHRQRVRGPQYAADDAHGPCGAGAHHGRRHVRERAALHRRP